MQEASQGKEGLCKKRWCNRQGGTGGVRGGLEIVFLRWDTIRIRSMGDTTRRWITEGMQDEAAVRRVLSP